MRETYPSQNRKKYKRTNGCSRAPSWPQVAAALFMVGIVVLQAIIVREIVGVGSAILTLMLVFSYLLLAIIVCDYVWLIISDPVDPRLLDEPFTERAKEMLVWCEDCKANVHIYSYHCKRCQRCVEEFDHHCKYVNNCIGRRNYASFFRIVINLILFLLLQFGQGLWVVLSCDSGNSNKWVGLALAIAAGLVAPTLIYLAVFHCYISFCEYGTTLKYLRGEENENKAGKSKEAIGEVIAAQKEIKIESEIKGGREPKDQ